MVVPKRKRNVAMCDVLNEQMLCGSRANIPDMFKDTVL
jgi:hypothetical protein